MCVVGDICCLWIVGWFLYVVVVGVRCVGVGFLKVVCWIVGDIVWWSGWGGWNWSLGLVWWGCVFGSWGFLGRCGCVLGVVGECIVEGFC